MRKTVAALVALAVLPFIACGGDVQGPVLPAAGAATSGSQATLDVVELGAAEAQSRMARGSLTSRVLTQAYLDRITRLDDAGPRLHSVIEINARALADADVLDAERRAGKVRGPLHGIPVLIKDNIDVAGMVNSAGSLALAEHRPKEDAFLVARLRAAGAVILGKTNLTEWANFRSTHATSGWSSRGGQTKNPYVLDRNPCGSSSGTGAAIAASLGAIGVGTETDGSIICPAAVNGLVGLKPTVGLVSRSGIIIIAISQDTAGPMARTVTDAAILLTVMAGVDPNDPAAPAKEWRARDYTTFLNAGALRGKRLGVLRQAMGYHPDVDAVADAAFRALRAQGAEIRDVEMATYDRWNDAELTVMLYEFKDGINTYLRRSGAPQASLEALITWNEAHADKVMPFCGQELFVKAQAKGPLTDAEYVRAREEARRLAGKEGLFAAFDRDDLDAIITPSVAPAWLTDPLLGDHFLGAGYGVAAVAGTPSITVPMGESRGLPLGLVFMGHPHAEGELLGMAYAFEQATKARRAPTYKQTLDL